MTDLKGKTIQVPADLLGSGQRWYPAKLRNYARTLASRSTYTGAQLLLEYLADAIDEQHPPRMDEPDYGGRVNALRNHRLGMYVRTVEPGLGEEAVGSEWVNVTTGWRYRWDQLIDPRPVDES